MDSTEKPQHTPGPWCVDGEFIRAERPEGGRVTTHPAIAAMYNDLPEQAANAALMAAAPAMLAACKRYVEEAERFASVNHFDISAPGTAYQQVLAAIAKARGES